MAEDDCPGEHLGRLLRGRDPTLGVAPNTQHFWDRRIWKDHTTFDAHSIRLLAELVDRTGHGLGLDD